MASPASGIRARLSNINRLRQVVQTFTRHGFISVIDQLGFSDKSLAGRHDGRRVHARFGRRLALALSDLGPTFVKLGQLMATREDILPPAVTTELATLQEHARPLSEKVVRKQIEGELGAPVEELFRSFDVEPLAAASIAQVHRAQTHDGEAVVVKVQRPGIAQQITEDLALLQYLAELLDSRVEDSRRYDPKGLVAEFSASLRAELDFRQEARAYQRMERVVGNTCHLPRVLDELSSERVMTLEFVRGRKVTAVRKKVARRALAHQILRAFTRQILQAGYFHADPHPGNLLALSGSDQLALLDFGAVGTIDRSTRDGLFRLAAAAAARDGRALARALLSMADVTVPIDEAAYTEDVGTFLHGMLERNLHEVPLAEMTGELFEITRRYGLHVRAEYFLLIRASVILDGVLRELDPELDPLLEARPHILRATVLGGAVLPATRIAHSLARVRWKRSRAFRVAVITASIALAGGITALAWLASQRV